MAIMEENQQIDNYAQINGINLYYEIHGSGKPLVLIHGGGSTIGTTFGRVLPYFAKYFKVIAVELQAHGHTSDRDQPETFEQDADDVAGLLDHLGIEKASLLGFSNGGNTAMQIAISHPQMVDQLIVASGFYKRNGMHSWFWGFMEQATIAQMPQALKDAYLAISNNTQEGLQNMHDKDLNRMKSFKDWEDTALQSIIAKTLLIFADADVMTPEHALEMKRLIPDARLTILPGAHGEYIGEIMTSKPDSELPLLTATMIKEFLEENQ